MRLPAFFTSLSPIRQTLEAIWQGCGLLQQDNAARNAQLAVSTAEDGLALWEADYSLAGGETVSALRRARILAAINGGHTLTPAQLELLAVTVGGADKGQVQENFSAWQVTLLALYQNRLPSGTAALEEMIARVKPAHLHILVAPQAWVEVPGQRYLAATGGIFLQLQSRDPD